MGITPDLAHPRPGGSSAPAVRARPGALMLSSLALIAALIAVAAYLTWVHYQPQALICAADGGCHTVQSSRYATIGPLPVALLGLGLAVVLLGVLSNGLTVLGVNPFWQNVAKGTLLVVAALLLDFARPRLVKGEIVR